MSTDSTRDCLKQALRQTTRLERRFVGAHSAALNATRNADRLVLANDLESIRLDLSVIHELLRDAIGSLSTEETPRPYVTDTCTNCHGEQHEDCEITWTERCVDHPQQVRCVCSCRDGKG